MMKVTRFLKQGEIDKKWVLINAQGHSIGKVAAEASRILQGKNKPTYTPNVNMGDNVIIINAGKVKITGRKADQKNYYRHSGYVGNMKVFTLREMLVNRPEYAMQHAVRLMLPKNRIASRMLKGLRIYSDDNYPKAIQIGKVIELDKEG